MEAKPGVKTDVPRSLAAKLIVEERARLASPEEAAQFRAERGAADGGGRGPSCRRMIRSRGAKR